MESPMAKALMGHKVGERVYVRINENAGYYVQIKAIEKTQDENENIRRF